MRYVWLEYFDEQQWQTLPERERNAYLEKCCAYDDELRKNGQLVADGEALQSARTAATLRWKNGAVSIIEGPFAETKEQLGGFGVFEARDINHAIELMSKHPAVKTGILEVRPAEASPECSPPASAATHRQEETRRFVCLGYLAESEWDSLSKGDQEAFIKECMAYDDVLRQNRHWVGAEALQSARTAKTLRWKAGRVAVTDGPYAETKEQLGGLVALAARDLSHAVELMSKHPGVRLGVTLEIRPTEDLAEMIRESRRRRSVADEVPNHRGPRSQNSQ